MKQNKLIAITGSMSSGKSTAIKIINELGYKVLKADDLNKDLLKDKNYLKELKINFPLCFIDNNLNKKLLKKEIFSNKESLKKINNLAHERIIKKILEESNNSKILFVEISAPNKYSLSIFNKIIVIETDEKIQFERLLKRDNIDINLANNIILFQKKDIEEACVHNSIIIENNEGEDSLKSKIIKVLKEIENEYKSEGK